jgi:glycosyltransferase involved in cell wall biosynthesis
MKKQTKPLVSVNIPTYNSEKTIGATLQSLKDQNYTNIEIIIIDSHSTDRTLELAKSFGTRIVYYDGTLLGARAEGVKHSNGQFILLMDSDQILSKDTIDKALEKMKGYDMVWLYERSYNPKKLMEKWYDSDRILTQEYASDFIEPVGGTILPRFYKKNILERAFENIPKKILPLCVAHDHAIVYFEARKISKKATGIGTKDNPAIRHREPWSWSNLFKKTYRYGVTTRKLVENRVYPELLKSKNKGRKIKVGSLKISLESNLLRIARAIPYLYGYFTGKNKKIPGL